jgi:hypothetical protein
MKLTLVTCLIFSCYCSLFGQTEAQKFKSKQLHDVYADKTELKDQLIKHNFSSLFTHADNSEVFGFIGDNYQRIRIKFISVTKDTASADTYVVFGKSMVKNNICDFRGTIKILNIRKYKSISYGVDDAYKNKGIKGEYFILGDFMLFENQKQNSSGIFKGVFQTDFFLDKNNRVQYDDIDLSADGYTNNQFVGQWINYKTNQIKRCNWGDFRIPNSGSFDIGAGDFSPDDKYLKYGWQSVRDPIVSNPNNKKAKQIEEVRWWK